MSKRLVLLLMFLYFATTKNYYLNNKNRQDACATFQMNDKNTLKKQVYIKIHALVQDKIDNSNKAIQSAIESRDNETKSSAGDKYETGRAMMHIEQQRNEVQKSNAIQLKNQLNRIDIEKPYHKIENGAFITTNQGNYFIAIGLGKVTVQGTVIYCISLLSPIGKFLQHKRVDDVVRFNRKEIRIIEIT